MARNPTTASPSRLAGAIAGGGIALWLIFSIMMAWNGRFQATTARPPIALGLFVLLPIVFFVSLYLRRGAFWDFCQTLDLKMIVAVHLWRVLAIDFLLCSMEGRLPFGFALPAGIGDMLTGLAAVPLAFALLRPGPSTRRRFVAWNCFGLLDLFLAVSLGILHSPSSIGILTRSGPGTLLMSELPRSLIPTFFVPLFILLHLLALARRNEIVNEAASEPQANAGARARQ